MGDRVGRLLAAVVRASVRRPWLTVLLSLAIALGAGVYAMSTLEFVTSALRLLPQRARYVMLLQQYLDDFAELDDILVAIEAPDPEHAKQYAERLVSTLRRDGLTSRITWRIDPSFVDGRGLLYLSTNDLARLRNRLFDYQAFIEGYAARPTLAQLLDGLNEQFANGMALGFLDLGVGVDDAADFRFIDAVVEQIGTELRARAPYVSPWDAGFALGGVADPDAEYYFSADKRLLFVFVEEQLGEGDFASNRGRIAMLRRTIGALASEFPEVRAGVTGGPTIADDEMATAMRDGALATALAALSTLALLLLAYRRLRAALLLVATLGASLLWALGIITLCVGHLSVFSIMFLSLVIGVGIDYGIYVLYRCDEEWTPKASLREALERTAIGTGPGMLLGALTAAGTFGVLMLTDFQGIREFGFVSAVAILMALLSMLTLLPALLAIAGRRPASASSRDRSESTWLVRLTTRPTPIVVAIGALSAVGVWGLLGVTFDTNMLKLQARGVESVDWEQRILASAGRSGFTALSTAETLDELRRKHDAFLRLRSVSEVESLLLLLPDAQADKIRMIHQFAPLVATLRVQEPPAHAPPALLNPLLVLRRRLGLVADGSSDERVRASARTLREKVDTTLAAIERVGPDGVASLERLQREVYQDFRDRVGRFQKSLDPQPVRAEDVPAELRARYVGRSGRYLLRVHPAMDIWQEAGIRRFIEDLRSVDADVTGPPVTNFEATRLIKRGYFVGTPYALVLVAAITLAVLRTVRGTALALAPVAMGVLWTLGVMRVLGLEFNLANVWALPLIVGTAAEYGINIYVRFREGIDRGGARFPRSVVRGITLSWLTTIAGFGSLMVAHHHGIFTLGLLLSVGSTASFVASVFVLPVLIRRLDVGNGRGRGAGLAASTSPA